MSERAEGLLLDCAGIARELGVSRTAAEKIMRRLPKVTFEDLAKVYIRRSDLLAYLEKQTAA